MKTEFAHFFLEIWVLNSLQLDLCIYRLTIGAFEGILFYFFKKNLG